VTRRQGTLAGFTWSRGGGPTRAGGPRGERCQQQALRARGDCQQKRPPLGALATASLVGSRAYIQAKAVAASRDSLANKATARLTANRPATGERRRAVASGPLSISLFCEHNSTGSKRAPARGAAASEAAAAANHGGARSAAHNLSGRCGEVHETASPCEFCLGSSVDGGAEQKTSPRSRVDCPAPEGSCAGGCGSRARGQMGGESRAADWGERGLGARCVAAIGGARRASARRLGDQGRGDSVCRESGYHPGALLCRAAAAGAQSEQAQLRRGGMWEMQQGRAGPCRRGFTGVGH